MRTSFTLLSNLPLIVFGQTPPSSPAPATTLSGEERARSLLDESLKDKNPDTRKQAVQALGLVGPARIENRSSFRTIRVETYSVAPDGALILVVDRPGHRALTLLFDR